MEANTRGMTTMLVRALKPMSVTIQDGGKRSTSHHNQGGTAFELEMVAALRAIRDGIVWPAEPQGDARAMNT